MIEEKPLSRWSRLKTEKRTQAAERGPTEIEEPAGGPLPAPVAEADDPDDSDVDLDALAEQHDLPAVDTLTEDSDFTQFMADGVPELLRKAALRKLWRSSPVFAVLDGLNDYDEDFNKIDKLLDVADTIAESKPEPGEPKSESVDTIDDSDDIDDVDELVDDETEQVPRQADMSSRDADQAKTHAEIDETPEKDA